MKNKSKTLKQLEEKYFGKKGTSNRDEYEYEVRNAIEKEMKRRAPKNKQWIVAFDNDSFNYSPSLELISACKKAKINGYRKYSTAQSHCDNLNSL